LTLSRSSVLGTIVDNDKVGPAPLVSVSDVFVNESDGEALFSITLDRASQSAITVNYQTADGSALAGNDYVGATSSVVFLPGETAKTVAIQLTNDGLGEADEKFSLLLGGVTGGATLLAAEGSATIEHNDGTVAVLPVLTMDDLVVSEGPNSFATFVLRLSHPSASAAALTYNVAFSNASAPTDVWSVSDTIRFAPGETVKVVKVPIIDDALVEQTESLVLSLGSPQGLLLGRTVAVASIVDNDTVVPAPLVSVNDVIVNETDGDAHFTITLDRASASLITVSFKTTDASALSGSDYLGATSSVTFAPGETAKTVAVQVFDDGVAEADERFGIQLTGATGGAVLADAQGTATLEHNDGAVAAMPVLNVDDIVINEGGNSLGTFVLRLSQRSANAINVSISVTGYTATSSTDYVYAPDTVWFAPGETVRAFSVPINDDATAESAETFMISFGIPFGSPQNVLFGRTYALGTIIDNDSVAAAPSVSVNDVVANESDGDARFAISLDRASATAITVNYQTTDISAFAGSDYVGVTSSVIFLPSEAVKTVAIPLNDDGAAEADEMFGLQLLGATGGAVLKDPQGTATIEHNDGPVAALPVLDVDDIVMSEGGLSLATFVLRLSQPSATAASVVFSPSFGTANFSDLFSPNGTVTFGPGETVKVVSIPLINDTIAEPSENFTLQWTQAQGLILGRTAIPATIIDDDGPVLIAPLDAVKAEGQAGSTPFTFASSGNRVGDFGRGTRQEACG